MISIDSVTLEVNDIAAADAFCKNVLGVDSRVRLRATEAPSTGFRGYSLTLSAAQPANADAIFDAAVEAGAKTLKPLAKSFWGYGGVFQAPDGTVWKVASEKKKNSGPASKEFTDIVLLLGVTDMLETKKFYVDRGLVVAKSFGRKYVEFDSGPGHVVLALYPRKAAAKDAGVSPEGSGSHRLVLNSSAGAFTDPDGYTWEANSA